MQEALQKFQEIQINLDLVQLECYDLEQALLNKKREATEFEEKLKECKDLCSVQQSTLSNIEQ